MSGEHRGDPRRSSADDQQGHHGIIVVRIVEASRDRLGRLHSLAHGGRDQPHAAELAGDVQTWLAALEPLIDVGEIDPATCAAEHQRDRVDRARLQTFTVADAARGVGEVGPMINDH